MNNWSLVLLMHELFVLLMNHRLVKFMDDLLVLFVNHWLMNLADFLLVDNRLMMLMDDRLMMLVDHILVMFNDHILMVLMEHILMVFLDDRLGHVGLNSGCLGMLNHLSRLSGCFKLRSLVMADDLSLLESHLNNGFLIGLNDPCVFHISLIKVCAGQIALV